MLTVEPIVEKFVERDGEVVRRENGLHVGESVRVEWTIPLDVQPSEVKVEVGPDVMEVSPVEKEDVGAGEWTYAVRVRVGSIRTDIQFSVPGYRVERTAFSADRALTG